MCPISWVDGTPSSSEGLPGIRFFSADTQRAYLIVCGGVQRVLTHFVGQTVPCLGEQCFVCRRGEPKKLKCYLGALRNKGAGADGTIAWEPVLWQVNENNFEDLGEPPYRGIRFETWKIKGSVTRIMIKRSDKPPVDLDRDPPLDVKQILQNKWLLHERGVISDAEIRGGAA